MNGALAFAAIPGLAAFGLWAVRDVQRFLLFAVLSAMVFPPALAQPGGAQVALADVLLLVALGAWTVRIAVGAESGPWVRANPLLPVLLGFLVVNLVSVVWSIDLGATTKMIIQLTEITLIFPLAFATLPRDMTTVREGLVLFTIACAVLAVLAFQTALPDLLAGQFEAVNLGFGLNKNAAGSYIAAGFVIAYVLLLGDGGRQGRMLLGVLLALNALGLLATLSRGSIIGAFAGILAASLLLRTGRARTATIALVAAIVYFGVVVPNSPKPDVRSGAYESSLVRVYSFENAIEKIQQRPVLGSGSGTYFDFIVELNIGLPDPNNMVLLTWAEIGLIGVLALFVLYGRFAWLWWRVAALPKEAATTAVAAGAVSLSLLLHFQFDVTWTRGTSSLAFACMGMMLAALRLSSDGRPAS